MIQAKAAEHKHASTDSFLGVATGPYIKHRTLNRKDGGHRINPHKSTCALAAPSGISFAKKASTNHKAEDSQRLVFKVKA